MLRQVHAINRYIKLLSDDGVNDRQRDLVTSFSIQYLADITILRVLVIGGIAAKPINTIKYVIDQLYLLGGAGLVVHLYPDVALDSFHLVNNLLFVQVGILVAVNNQHTL